MFDFRRAEARRLVFCFVVLALIAIAAALPFKFGGKAHAARGRSGHKAAVPNYDIRFDEARTPDTLAYFERARNSMGKTAANVADIRDGFVRGETALRTRL